MLHKPINKDKSTRQGAPARLTLSLAMALVVTFSSITANRVNSRSLTEKPSNGGNDTWYQIEMIVFTNHTPGNSSLEDWSRDLELGYPDSLAFLNHTEPVSITEPSLNPQISTTEKPFMALTKEQRQQSALAKRLQRSPYFKVVFHEAWRQPVISHEQPSHIPIIAGQQFDRHFELEGYITVSKNRYLHFGSHLWLNKFEAYTSQYTLPQKPGMVAGLRAIDAGNISASDSEPASQTAPLTEKILTLPPVPEPDVLDAGSLDYDMIEQGSITTYPDHKDNQQPEESSTTRPQYRLIRTVTLQEHRRMRSRELHYLDHPLFGILVIITPYQPPQAQEVPFPKNEPEADSLEDLLKSGQELNR